MCLFSIWRDRRPRSYIDLERGGQDYYLQTCIKPVNILIRTDSDMSEEFFSLQ